MKLVCDYNGLLAKLNDLSSVIDDAFVNDNMRNVIFQFNKTEEGGTVTLIGCNPAIIFRIPLTEDIAPICEINDDEMAGKDKYFVQLAYKELMAFLGSYKSLKRTFVESVCFEVVNPTRIRCTIVERDASENKEESETSGFLGAEMGAETVKGTPYVSYYMFASKEVPANIIQTISITTPEEELISFRADAFKACSASLLPIMQNGTNLYSYMTFDNDFVVTFNQAYTTLMANTLKEVFNGIKLSYRCVSFLDKIIPLDVEAIFEAVKTERYLYIKMNNSEIFLVYDSKLPAYKQYMDLFKKERGVSVDRQYLKDVLKRLKLTNDSVEVSVIAQENKVVLKNSKFQQDIDILHSKGMDGLATVNFKIMPDVLNKAIIDIIGDKLGNDNVMFYLTIEQSGNIIISFADDAEKSLWFSVARVKTY